MKFFSYLSWAQVLIISALLSFAGLLYFFTAAAVVFYPHFNGLNEAIAWANWAQICGNWSSNLIILNWSFPFAMLIKIISLGFLYTVFLSNLLFDKLPAFLKTIVFCWISVWQCGFGHIWLTLLVSPLHPHSCLPNLSSLSCWFLWVGQTHGWYH